MAGMSIKQVARRGPRRRVSSGCAHAGVLGACCVMALGVGAAPAQAITYSQQTLALDPNTAGFYPAGVAVDAAGDVFVSSVEGGGSDTGAVSELLAGGGSLVPVAFSGPIYPTGVAVDAAGDVFVVNEGGADDNGVEHAAGVLELPAGSETQQLLQLTGLCDPQGIAVDAAGDVFVANGCGNDVLKLPADGGPQTAVSVTGLNFPTGVAVDAAGDVFVANSGDNDVLELPADGAPQKTLKFNGLSAPYGGMGVALDAAGDVFISNPGDDQVLELPPGGSPVTLPFTGLGQPDGLAVDAAGDVFAADLASSTHVDELSPYMPSGSLAIVPGSGPAGTQIAVTSVTPCPLNASSAPGFGSSRATLTLYAAQTGAVVASATSSALDETGDWSGELTVPSGAANGSAYVVGARCVNPQDVMTQTYTEAGFVVETASSGGTGPQGPPGPQGNPGANGTNGTNGTPGAPGTNGTNGTNGAAGAAGKNGTNGTDGTDGTNAARPTGSTSTCTTTLARSGAATTTCTVTYQYPTAANSADVFATTMVHRRTQTVGRGTLRDHKLKVTFRLGRLRRGRYTVTFSEPAARGRFEVIGHTSIDVS
jgi:hypothetical protein